HLCYIKSVDNHRVYRFYDGLRDELLRLGIEAIQTPGRMMEVLEEHDAIVNAFDKGLLAETEEAVARHLLATKAAIARAMPTFR
ncbi:MAG: FCD domain-containing protein, partial [Anaerolineae bacterium]